MIEERIKVADVSVGDKLVLRMRSGWHGHTMTNVTVTRIMKTQWVATDENGREIRMLINKFMEPSLSGRIHGSGAWSDCYTVLRPDDPRIEEYQLQADVTAAEARATRAVETWQRSRPRTDAKAIATATKALRDLRAAAVKLAEHEEKSR